MERSTKGYPPVPPEAAQQLAALIRDVGDAFAQALEKNLPTSLIEVSGTRYGFPIFLGMLVMAKAFQDDPEFMDWLMRSSGLHHAMDLSNLLGGSLPSLLKTAVQEIEDELAKTAKETPL